MLNLVCKPNMRLSLLDVVLQVGQMINHTEVSFWTFCFLESYYSFVMCYIIVQSVKIIVQSVK
jgi:hypothetical protein